MMIYTRSTLLSALIQQWYTSTVQKIYWELTQTLLTKAGYRFTVPLLWQHPVISAKQLTYLNPLTLQVFDNLRQELYSALQWTYGVWAEYSGKTQYAKQYNDKSIAYIDSLLLYIDKSTPEYAYHYADHALRTGDYNTARDNYIKALGNTPQNTRLYAQAAYGLAMAYKELNDSERYREWLINSAISDQITPLKENLALQQLALVIKDNENDLETANRYLKYSLEDAIFYNNRLRMLEISEKFGYCIRIPRDCHNPKQTTENIYTLYLHIVDWICGCRFSDYQREKTIEFFTEESC